MKRCSIFIASFFLIILSSCSSYLSVEKRIYRDGFHIEQNLFSKTDNKKDNFPLLKRENEKPRHLIFYSEPVLISSSSLSVCNNEEKNIFADNSSQLARIEFIEDTLPKKKVEKKHKVFMKDDIRKDVTKKERKTPVIIIIGVVLGVFSFSCLVWLLVGGLINGFLLAGFLSSLVGLIFSVVGIDVINRNNDRDGKGLAIAGFILNLFFPTCLIAYMLWASIGFLFF